MQNKLSSFLKAKSLVSCSLVFFICSCAQRLPESHYTNFAYQWRSIHNCFNKGYMSAQLFAEAKNAYSYNLNTWSYDRSKLENEIALSHGVNPTPESCRNVEADAYQTISYMRQNQAQEVINQQNWNNGLQQMNANKPVFCNTIGTMTICN